MQYYIGGFQMRRFFDYDSDRLNLTTDVDYFNSALSPSLAAFALPDMFAAPIINLPLFANIDGTPGDETLDGTEDADTINGFAGNDIINGFGGDDILNGGDGDDIINGGEGFDTIDGGAGFDLVSFAGSAESVFIFLDGTSFNATGVSATNVEGVIGTDFDDSFYTGTMTTPVYFEGGAGDDSFRGGDGDDTFIGGDGDDFVIARRGNDVFDGGAGSDRLSTFSLGLSFNPTEAYAADLALGQVMNNGFGDVVTLIDVEGLSGGTFFADSFLGDENDNVIFGNLGGADLVDGRGGDDLLWLVSATGTVIGGAGIDTFSLISSRFIQGTFDQLSIFQGVEIDLVMGTMRDGFNEGGGSISGIENFEGSFYSDVLIGDSNDNVIQVFEGQDFADGGAGVDTISYDRAFGSAESVQLDLAAGTAIQDVVKVDLQSPAALDAAFLTDALNGDLNITITTNAFGGGEVYGVVRGVESDVTDGSGIRTVTFSPFGLDGFQDAGFGNVSFSSALAEVRLVMIVDAVGALTYTLDVSVQGIPIADILQVILNSVNAPLLVDVVTDSGGTIAMGTDTSTLLNFENIIGSSFDDMLTGDMGNNEITGGSGDDIIDGATGNDIAIFSGNQADYSIVNNGDGTFTVTDNVGTDGQDTLSNIEFAQFADASVDLSIISAPINGTPGNDNPLQGTSDDDVINGLEGNDVIYGLAGDDILNGGDGADRLIGGEGADALNGGAGFDSADYRGATSAVRFNVDTGGTLGEAAGDSFSGIERYYLSDFNDIITGSDANEFFYGEDGNDQINGGGGIDRIYGGDGDDIQRGQDGNDTLYGSAGADQLNGGAGLDTASYDFATSAVVVNLATGGTGGDAAGDTYFGIEIVQGSDFDDTLIGNTSANRFIGGLGADTLDGGSGFDSAFYTTATAGVILSLATGGTGGDAAGDSFTSIEWVYASNFDDNITGDSGANRLYGLNGNDVLDGAGGNDRLFGGNGDDTITGGDGIDVLYGEAGDDAMSGGAGNDFFFGGAGADSFDGGDNFDTVNYLAAAQAVSLNMTTGGTAGEALGDSYISIERVFGSQHDDNITGDSGNNTIFGATGSDYISGGAGADNLYGGAGSDSFGYDTTEDGQDFIRDFTTDELIYILGGDPAFDTWAELQAVGTDAGANLIFDFGGGNRLIILNQNLADLDASNFDFSGSAPSAPPPAGQAPALASEAETAFSAEIIDVFDIDALI